MKSFSQIAEKLGIGNAFFDAVLNILNGGSVPKKDVRSMKRFLILQYDKPLGSALNTTPVVEALRRAIPDAFIAMAASGFAYKIFKSNPYINEIYETPHPATQFPKTLAYFLRHMWTWRRSFDCVITDSFNDHTKQTLLQIASGIPVRMGYANRSNWEHYPLTFPEDAAVRSKFSVIENNLRILDLLGHPSPPLEPSIFIDQADILAAENLLRAEGVPEGGALVVVVPQGSGNQPVNWFDERFAQVGDRLFESLRARIIFLGVARDAESIEQIRGQMHAPSFNFAGKTDIPQLAALLCQADLMLTIDTGVMHLARAVKLPMVLLASAYQTTKEWLPLGIDRYLILRRDNVPCALCWKSSCATMECMDEISVEDAMSAIETQLSRFPPSAEQRRERVERALGEKVAGAEAR